MDEKDYLEIIGKNIVELRKKKKMSSNKLALECGMDKSNLIPIEKGRINVTIRTLVKIAEGLDVPLEDILKFKK